MENLPSGEATDPTGLARHLKSFEDGLNNFSEGPKVRTATSLAGAMQKCPHRLQAHQKVIGWKYMSCSRRPSHEPHSENASSQIFVTGSRPLALGLPSQGRGDDSQYLRG